MLAFTSLCLDAHCNTSFFFSLFNNFMQLYSIEIWNFKKTKLNPDTLSEKTSRSPRPAKLMFDFTLCHFN